MRSQLDCHDPRLPGTGTFDIKTRACVTVRHDRANYLVRQSVLPLLFWLQKARRGQKTDPAGLSRQAVHMIYSRRKVTVTHMNESESVVRLPLVPSLNSSLSDTMTWSDLGCSNSGK